MIAVVDYGLGNLRSVSKALAAIGAEVEVTNNPERIAKAKAIVFPGVGAFQRGMENIQRLNILPSLAKAIRDGKPFLGICLGLQLLFTESKEHGTHQGLNIIQGKVKRFDSKMKVPHMGWNRVKIKNKKSKIKIFEGISNESYFYFVHTYYVEPENKEVVIGTTEYGRDFVSVVNRDNVWGVQFHPEKSTKMGLKLLENFCRYVS